MNWIYRNKELTLIPKEKYGFIYEILYSNGNKYIGKKNFYHKRKLPPLKGKKRKRTRTVESDWKVYEGSPKRRLPNHVTITSKKILRIVDNKTQLTYFETHYQMIKQVLFNENYINGNILGKFYPNEALLGKKYKR